MSYWNEIRSTFEKTKYDSEIDGAIIKSVSVDGCKTGDENEERKLIAKVILTSSGEIAVVYIDNSARYDDEVQNMIFGVKNIIKDHYSIWVDCEDDGTYDISVWDELANDRVESLQVYRIKSLKTAKRFIEDIIKNNPLILFDKLPDQKKY